MPSSESSLSPKQRFLRHLAIGSASTGLIGLPAGFSLAVHLSDP
jgi:hypothetical protein